jgi:hypothetical protein
MQTIKVFLASSSELAGDRRRFETEIYRKHKLWAEKGIGLYLDIWEDLTARMSATRSQDEYNQKVREADLFVLLAFSKVGMYTAEEFETAFGAFQAKKKPFIFTYFKSGATAGEPSLQRFKDRLAALGHFYSSYETFSDLWLQFNRELDRLLLAGFKENVFIRRGTEKRTVNQGEKSVYIENAGDVNFTIN